MRDSAQKSIQLFPSLHFSPCLLLPVGFEITTMHKNIKHKKENYPKNYYSSNECDFGAHSPPLPILIEFGENVVSRDIWR